MTETKATQLDRPGSPVGEAGRSSPAPEALPASPSSRYVLDRELARGGMGRIFAGRDLRLRREVAIKILRTDEPELRERFEREILLGARLQHPGIVPVYDAGCFPSGEPFLVMKLVPGRSLARAMTEAETIEERLSLLPVIGAVADAVAYAHDRGVVHRDLKPSNILVGAFGEVAIIDWGLAKDIGVAEPGPAPPVTGPALVPAPARGGGLTETGTVLGTPGFMAPEQAAGAAADARSDVYAMGAIIHHLLTGGPPSSDTPLDPAWVPDDLRAIVAKALAFNPTARYPSAFELAEDLACLAGGQLVRARGYSRLDLVRRFAARHPLVVVAALATAAVVAAVRC